MSSEVSIIVRARDMATRVLRGVGREAQTLGRSLGFGGAIGGIGKGGAIFALGMAFRSISQYAREMKDNADISAELRRSVDAINIVNSSAAGVGNTIRGWGATALAGFYRGIFRLKAMMGGMSWGESGAAADMALTDWQSQSAGIEDIKKRMKSLSDAKAEYAAERKGEEATLKLLEDRQARIREEIEKTAKVSTTSVGKKSLLDTVGQKKEAASVSSNGKSKIPAGELSKLKSEFDASVSTSFLALASFKTSCLSS